MSGIQRRLPKDTYLPTYISLDHSLPLYLKDQNRLFLLKPLWGANESPTTIHHYLVQT